jgi:hypothetical protein
MMGHEITFTPIDQSLVWLLAGVTINLSPWARRETSAAAASSGYVLQPRQAIVGG